MTKYDAFSLLVLLEYHLDISFVVSPSFLGLENIDLIPDGRGQLEINDHYCTTIPGIYAVGDVIGLQIERIWRDFWQKCLKYKR